MGDFGFLGLLRDQPLTFVLLAASLVGALSLHEYAHALAADLQGDRMPRAMGRLTLNPLRHLDPMGTLFIVLVGFGWGKPVEFRPQALSSQRFGAAIVALAGPAMNLLLALIAGFVFVWLFDGVAQGPVGLFVGLFFAINVILAVFNLLPLPPLDGSRLLTMFLPPSKQKIVFFLDQYGFLILIVLVFVTQMEFLSPIVDVVQRGILALVGG